MRELAGGELERMKQVSSADRFTGKIDVWASRQPVQALLLNIYGSLLAADFGFTPVPLYGPVFFVSPPRGDGVMVKMPIPVKDEIRNRMWAAVQVLSGSCPDGISEQAYANTWQTVRDLLHAHDKQHQIVTTG
jgi:hypothetical protein